MGSIESILKISRSREVPALRPFLSMPGLAAHLRPVVLEFGRFGPTTPKRATTSLAASVVHHRRAQEPGREETPGSSPRWLMWDSQGRARQIRREVPSRSKGGTRFRTAWLLGGTRRRSCSPSVWGDDRTSRYWSRSPYNRDSTPTAKRKSRGRRSLGRDDLGLWLRLIGPMS